VSIQSDEKDHLIEKPTNNILPVKSYVSIQSDEKSKEEPVQKSGQDDLTNFEGKIVPRPIHWASTEEHPDEISSGTDSLVTDAHPLDLQD